MFFSLIERNQMIRLENTQVDSPFVELVCLQHSVLNRKEARNYQQLLGVGKSMYSEIDRILTIYQSGIHELSTGLKVDATRFHLLGGGKEKVVGIASTDKGELIRHWQWRVDEAELDIDELKTKIVGIREKCEVAKDDRSKSYYIKKIDHCRAAIQELEAKKRDFEQQLEILLKEKKDERSSEDKISCSSKSSWTEASGKSIRECKGPIPSLEVRGRDFEHRLEVLLKEEKVESLSEVKINSFPMSSRSEVPEVLIHEFKEPILHFAGRLEELKELEKYFGVTNRVAIIGLGGIGKTQLSRYYAEKYQSRYKIILSINAESISSLWKDIGSCIEKLAYSQGVSVSELSKIATLNREELCQLLKQYASLCADIPTLILIDNLNHSEFMSTIKNEVMSLFKSWHFLITSRTKWISTHVDAKTLLLTKGLSEEEGVHYLQVYTGDLRNLSCAEKIVKYLKCFPLALGHAAAFMKAKKIAMPDYLKRLIDLQVQGDERIYIPGDYRQTIYQMCRTSLDVIKEENPFTIQLIEFMSICSETGIEDHYIKKWLKKFHPQHLVDGFKIPSLQLLYRYSLVEAKRGSIYIVHPIFQAVIKENVREDQGKLKRLEEERNQILSKSPSI